MVYEKTNNENGIFSGLANPVRLQILQVLEKKSLRITKISSQIGITIQAIQRHIDKLLELGLIIKDSEGNLTISASGEAVLVQIPTFLFLSKHKEYFQNHSFLGIPDHLVKRIGDLANCEFLDDPMHGWQQAKNFVEGAKKFCYGATPVQPIEFYDVAKKLMEKKVIINLVFPQDMKVAKGFERKRKENGWMDYVRKGYAKEKTVRKIPIMVGVSEKEAQLMFASTKSNQIDSGALFYSKDLDFRNWCMDLFNHYWKKVEKVNHTKFEEI